MCGIFCIFSTSLDYDVLQYHCKLCEFYIKRRGPNYYSSQQVDILNYKFVFSASVLWLQGSKLVKQPIVNDKSCFVFNGDIFGGCISEEERISYGDTIRLLEKLEDSRHVMQVLSNNQGPYAFIYLDKKNLKLYFSRDIYGRRSLLAGKIKNGLFLTSTTSGDINCIEIPAIGVFSYDLRKRTLILMPWGIRNNNFLDKLREFSVFLNMRINILEVLDFVQAKIYSEPREECLEIFETIKSQNQTAVFEALMKIPAFLKNVQTLHSLLETAISKRISTQPKYCQNCILNEDLCDHALIGVLFSGGIDCTVLALLSDKFTESHRTIDLINVAFEKQDNYDTPDRQTGRESFEELKKLRPDRKWKFVEVNVSINELNDERNAHIRHLIHPLKTIMDDSLGCALWFASRGRSVGYESPSRVLLVGMGADELFGGYTRHRAALNQYGWRGLHGALNEDWQNIAYRNLARDDRVVSDNGRQLRTPYLDEDLVNFVRFLDCWEKTCPSHEIPAGIGDKVLLRTLGYHLGLKCASTFKKRAIQFGSRIADSKEKAHEISPRLSFN